MYIHFPALSAVAGQSHRSCHQCFHPRDFSLISFAGIIVFLNRNRVIHIHGNIQLLTVIAIYFSSVFLLQNRNFLIGKFHVSIINSPPLFSSKGLQTMQAAPETEAEW